MKHLIVINDPPYGSEKPYNALRLATQVQRDYSGEIVRVFLMADAAFCAIKGQKTPNGYYNIERMLKSFLDQKGEVKMCCSCADARGITGEMTIDGVQKSTMAELAKWYIETDKIINF